MNLSVKVAELEAALESANDLCRSAFQIAQRDGKDTNWEAFRNRLSESLDIQHKVMYPHVKASIVLMVVGLMLLASPALAGQPCRIVHQQIVAHHGLHHAFVAPQVSFFVGAPIRVEAEVKKALQADPDYAAFQKFKQFQQQLTAPATPDITPPAPDTTANVSSSSLLKAKCAKCHEDFDGEKPISGQAYLRFSDMALLSKGVPGKMQPVLDGLTDAELSGVMIEMRKLAPVDPAPQAGVLE